MIFVFIAEDWTQDFAYASTCSTTELYLQPLSSPFWFHFLNGWCWACFQVYTGRLYCISSLEKYLCSSFAHISVGFLLLSCKIYLWILDISFLLHIWFENIFSHSVGCLVKDSVPYRTFLMSVKSNVSITSLVVYAFCAICNMSLLHNV